MAVNNLPNRVGETLFPFLFDNAGDGAVRDRPSQFLRAGSWNVARGLWAQLQMNIRHMCHEGVFSTLF